MRCLSMAFMMTLITLLLMCGATTSETVTNYLSDGRDIKAASQVSSTGRTQVILQKGQYAVVCTIYFSVLDKGWISQGCDPLP